jgi:hypothetical protein
MLAPVTHILPITTIRRERLLPVNGRIVVRKGQKVSATDVVAEAKLSQEHMLLDIARSLGVPAKEADQNLKCKAGDAVAQGDILAGPVGFAQRVVRAPKNGQVIVAGEGQILLEMEGGAFELKAGIPGIVAELIGDRGVLIETSGAVVQGVWGNGRIDFGLLNVLARTADDLLKPDRLDVSLRGSVLLGGYCEDPQVLKTAADLPLRGLIIGSVHPDLLSAAAKVRFPVIVLDGVGRRGINPMAFKLLATNERREAAINAEPWDRYSGKRPELVIPLPASAEIASPRETVEFAPGLRVLVVRAPCAGKVGVVTSIQPGMNLLPSGIKAPVAEIDLEDGDHVVVPLANLEALV